MIVACGGGTPCFFDNMDYMNSRGDTVWLHAGRERLVERLVRAGARRPAIAGLSRAEVGAYIKKLLLFVLIGAGILILLFIMKSLVQNYSFSRRNRRKLFERRRRKKWLKRKGPNFKR